MNRRKFVVASAAALGVEQAKAAEGPASILRLYGRTARFDGAVRMDRQHIYCRWRGDGSATWTVQAPQAGEYEVAICAASGSGGASVEIRSGASAVRAPTRVSAGPYGQPLVNYERLPIAGTIRLNGGSNELVFSLAGLSEEQFRLRSVELIPVDAKPALEATRQRALAARASTDWFAQSGYGVIFHWTGESAPRRGPIKPYRQAVDEFPVQAFVEMVQETGAAFVMFTLNHAIAHCPAPIRAWEQIQPGMTTERDLLGELAVALERVGIRFIIYFNSPRFVSRRPESQRRSNFEGVSSADYVDMHCRVLDEIGLRYGDKLAGYWFDSWYQSYEQYPDIRQDLIFAATKTGNPNRISAFNFWYMPSCTDFQEYWAGEMGAPEQPATSRYIQAGAGRGLQHHVMLYLDAPWVHSRENSEMEPLRYSAERLTSFIRGCAENQGVVTVNLGIYQDGGIGPEAMNAMRAVRRDIRGA